MLLPVLLGVLLIGAIAFVAGRFRGEHVEAQDLRDTTTRASGSVAPPVIPPPTTTQTTSTTTPTTVTTSTTTDTVTATAAPAAAVVGARCGEPGATGVTADGATVYCTLLQYTNRYLWSVHQDQIPNPVVTSPPLTAPTSEDESPVRICMQETGHSRLRCAADILRGNGG